jgi:hypothetical protein
MKKTFIALSAVLLTSGAMAQTNVHLSPAGGNVCNPMVISLTTNGNSFQPTSYLWSTGETTATISITTSGTYTLTVTGTLGSSGTQATRIRSGKYDVLPPPEITALSELWVCKGDTVRLAATPGYDSYVWSNGDTLSTFAQKMNKGGTGTPSLDTLNVSYTASIANLCSTTSDEVVIRGIRKPHGVGAHYNGRMNISPSDSIPAGLVLEYLYPVTYEMQFMDIENPDNIIKYTTAPGSRKAPASMLESGKTYSVTTSPIINDVEYCPGMASIIGISSGNRIGIGFNTEEPGYKTFIIYDVNGRKLLEKQAEQFNREWLDALAPQLFIVYKIGTTTEVVKMQRMH